MQKSIVITSELEVTTLSSAFQKLCLVLKFSFKTQDGIFLVQNCIEILPVIMESYTGAVCVQCCLWLHESQLPTSAKVQDQVSQIITPNNDYFSMVRSVHCNWLCISQGARPGLTLCRRWDDIKCVADLRSQFMKISHIEHVNICRQQLYEGYPESKFRLWILPLQRCGHNGACVCRVFLFFVKARTQFADIWTVFMHRAVCL